MTDYGLLAKQIVSLAEVDAHWLPVLSNAAALLWDALDDINWAGFYLVDPATVTGEGAEPGAIPSAHDSRTPELRLGPFRKSRLRAHSVWSGSVWYGCGNKDKSAGRGRAPVPWAHRVRLCIQLRGSYSYLQG